MKKPLIRLPIFLKLNDTRFFIVLKNGRIVIEEYYGRTILNNAEFTKNSEWYWASAGKSLTAVLVGMAQVDGLLNIDNPTADYLGNGWTSLSTTQGNQIKIKHQLSMTTGLDYTTGDLDCKDPNCLSYLNPAGDVWYYHNAPYSLLHDVIENTSSTTINDFTRDKLSSIGVDGIWRQLGDKNVFWSNAREAARFGHLVLSNGIWDGEIVYPQNDYFQQMTQSSQTLNPSYGFLWWLNGKESTIFPGSPASISSSVCPNAPTDMISAIGLNGQFIDIIPSENMVVIRMGEDGSASLSSVDLHNEMWLRLAAILP
jgi:CubicO group peptidase (beta-lactamase class C family)